MSSGESGLLVAGSLCWLMVALVCQICLAMQEDAELVAASRKSAVRNR